MSRVVNTKEKNKEIAHFTKKKEPTKPTLQEFMYDLASEICVGYCKYSLYYNKEEQRRELIAKCKECPLNRLIH